MGVPKRQGAATSLAHLAALWAFAVVEPTLSALSDNADLFVARQVQGTSFVVVVLAFAFLPPLVLLGLELLAGLAAPWARAWLHLVFVWGLAALLVLYVLKKALPGQGNVLIPLSWIAAFGLTYLYTRGRALPMFLTVLAPAGVLLVALFLFASPSHKLIFPDHPKLAKAAPSRTPVVMVVFDELPSGSLMNAHGRIDSRLFPHFAELARQSTWYRTTAAAADQTEEAVPAILDAKRPRHGTLPILPDHPNNIFTLFGASHQVHAMEHITWLCPPSLCPNPTSTPRRMYDLASALSLVYAHVVAPKPIETKLAQIGSTWQEAQAAKDPSYRIDPATAPSAALTWHPDAQFERFLETIRPEPAAERRAPFYLLHSSLPHVPWKYTPSGHLYTGNFRGEAGLEDGGQVWGPDPVLVHAGRQRHLLQAQFCDLLLGRLLQHLRRTGLLDRALVVVTADHGAAFIPNHNRRPVDVANAGRIALVPFFVKAPGQRRGRVSDEGLQTIDVMPTIADVLHQRIPWRIDGRSARALAPNGRRTVTTFARFGKSVTLPPAVLQRQRLQSIRTKLALFGSNGAESGLYAVGPDRDTVGLPVADLHPTAGRGTVALSDADALQHVDKSSHFAPALLEGSVPHGVTRAVVALNGRVQATMPTYSDGGGTSFSLMIPEGALRAGRNRVEVLAASGKGARRRFTELRQN